MIAFFLAALLDAAPPAAPTNADVLFSAAREARSRSGYAHYAVYATVVRFRSRNHVGVSTWDTVEDLRRRLVFSHALEREEAAHPHVPHGFNIGMGGSILPPSSGGLGASGPTTGGTMPSKGQIVNAEPGNDPFGQLTFAVDQDFGLALNAQPIGATANLSEVASSVTTLPHIGRTGTIARTYAVTDLGDVTENDIALHHLALRPLRDPYRYRLRELWLDPKTSLPVRAIVSGIGNRGPLDTTRWRVDFKQVEGGTFIERETALEPLNTGSGRLDEVTITFAELRPTNRLTPQESLGLAGEVGTTDP